MSTKPGKQPDVSPCTLHLITFLSILPLPLAEMASGEIGNRAAQVAEDGGVIAKEGIVARWL